MLWSGLFVYFERLHFSNTSDCEEDYIQFGRDILFITSYRSKKFCGSIIGSSTSAGTASSTKLSERIYTETSDDEMDIWVQMRMSGNDPPKTLSLVVTPFLKKCSYKLENFQKCGSGGKECVRTEFFCDGKVNCPTSGNKPPGETSVTHYIH